MKKDEALNLVKINGLKLKDLEENLRQDQDVVLEAVKQNGSALKYADEIFKKNYNRNCINNTNSFLKSYQRSFPLVYP